MLRLPTLVAIAAAFLANFISNAGCAKKEDASPTSAAAFQQQAIQDIQNNPHIPPADKAAAIAQIRSSTPMPAPAPAH